MTDVLDGLIECGVREELAPKPALGDVVDAVIAALATDHRVQLPDLVRRVRVRARWRRWLPGTIACAAAAVVVVVLIGRDEPVATAERALLIAGSNGQFSPRSQIPSGAFVWCTGEQAAVLAVANGSRATAAPGAVFALGFSGVADLAELLGGTLELRPAAAPWRLHCALGEVLAAPGTLVRCEFAPAAPEKPDPGDPVMNLDALRSRLQSTATATLTVSVLLGTADLATAQGKETLQKGESRIVPAPGNAAAVRGKQLYAVVRTELAPPTDEASMVAWKEVDDKQQELARLLLRQPAVMGGIVAQLLRDLADAKLGAETHRRLVGIALLDEGNASFTAVTALWPTTPDLFTFEEQVALAERGFAPACAKLLEFLAEPRGALSARAAAALAFSGDASMREVLAPWTKVTMTEAEGDAQKFDARCQAAVALASLGDATALQSLRADVRTFAERRLAGNEPEQTAQASWYVQRTLYYLATQKPRLAWLSQRIGAFAGPDLGDGTDVAKVRAALQRLVAK